MKRPNQGNTRYFQKLDTYTKAYFLGFIAADGCIQHFTKNSIGLSITLNVRDKILLDKLKEEIGNEHQIRVWSAPQTFDKNVITTFCRFQIANKDLVNDIQKYGITERKSLTMENIIKNIPKKFRRSFILGYFDGDGSVILPKGQMKFAKKKQEYYQLNTGQIHIDIRGTEQFLSGIAKELKLKAYRIAKYDSTYRLSFTKKEEIKKFFNIYKDQEIFLKRKYDKFIERL